MLSKPKICVQKQASPEVPNVPMPHCQVPKFAASPIPIPPADVHAKPLPRFGCGGPAPAEIKGSSQIGTKQDSASSNQSGAPARDDCMPLPANFHRRPEEHVIASSSYLGLVPEVSQPGANQCCSSPKPQAMPLPRLGCGGPAPKCHESDGTPASAELPSHTTTGRLHDISVHSSPGHVKSEQPAGVEKPRTVDEKHQGSELTPQTKPLPVEISGIFGW